MGISSQNRRFRAFCRLGNRSPGAVSHWSPSPAAAALLQVQRQAQPEQPTCTSGHVKAVSQTPGEPSSSSDTLSGDPSIAARTMKVCALSGVWSQRHSRGSHQRASVTCHQAGPGVRPLVMYARNKMCVCKDNGGRAPV